MSSIKNYLPKYTYKRNPKISNKAANKQNELMRLNDEKLNDDATSITNKNTVTSSDFTEKQNQGVISSFVIGHIISENELALASPYSYRELNDVFDEFLELQKQSNKVFGKSSIKKSEKNSDIKKNNQNKNVNNNGRENSKKRDGGVGGNSERNQREIAKRALKSKPTNNINAEKSEKISTDKNRIQRNVLKNNDEFNNKIDKKIGNRRIDIVNQDDINFEKYNNEFEDWHNMYPILTSTPNSSINFETNTITKFHNNSNVEDDDMGDILPDSYSFPKNGGRNSPKENLSTFKHDQLQQSQLFNAVPKTNGKEEKEIRYPSQDTNTELSLQSYAERDEIRRFVFKQLSDDDNELEGFYDFKSGNYKKD
ncbi:hypothetical protein RhiirA5_450889 [Rhizophagus irregularis]|uniref:Uncharacterized protein n=4 Tax=Rhizophagus irregularis TaxID=588596 RepID=A0A2I1EL51_9GLOM|nr:hypothetical protein GLOIN_2v1476100 [Rhizophagus irregularis DAOM 181602=DAOM 197198]EXX70112.1 hypothetical protein RirG_090310 [Rhizophagus irregularis DAOM 197198w]PKC03611.1 hypothetical protein RhiirA5_450889 [Rhizophagus irregularis]PKY22853.1 hypothetical protein RhiirB3_504229 [Rhizophagus irregularis]POG74565.1 hypothetical protein GLOIN_2v1476100 [Rhizophagus irregularis DAOM 181602=DAOM 197198]UZO10382.1 hypothetical protein OCT59_001969 [Rhizophagus irregularis]|eukprot:XP_025181431.1 hypothetical protein GLOIN_2v1476100 [Rhizophagus irregularis DAOM 181602=DAOM 197198]